MNQSYWERTSFFKDVDYTAAGKTGTAEIRFYDDPEHPFYNTDSINTAHVGFAPYEDPQIAYAVLIPYITTNTRAVPPTTHEIARAAVDKYFEMNAKTNEESPSTIKAPYKEKKDSKE